MTFVVYTQNPTFPATDQSPNCVRYQVGNQWVDSDLGVQPTQADIDALSAPGIAEIARRATLKGNARAVVLINALTTKDDVALNAAVAARYPGLAGDAIKAVQDIALVMAYQYRNGS